MKVDGDGDGDGDNGVRVLNHQQLHSVDKSDIEEGVVSKHQNSVENGVCNGTENVKAQHAGIVQVPAPIQVPQQQQSQGTSVCWERFLHLRTLKVLLVENDDSTRHVVAALLRNCSYEVIETSNGMQAWKILEDLANHVDIVLTEVVMPFVSGVGLLCKIMAHKTRKNVPVIMMSSHDSMGLVFKCLSKGAVDFLVKPIRKNELKILWQHVWRRCHSSSGSGSESASGSGTQTQKSVKSKNVEKSGNNASSNDEDDDGSFGLNVGDGSDDGSGTQSSWTKQAVEVESPRPLPPWDQLTECPDSTCAQVIHSNGEISDNKHVPVSKGKEPEEEQQQLENNAFGKDLQIGAPPKPELELKYAAAEDQNKTRPINPVEQGFSGVNEHDNKGLLDIDTANNFQCQVGKPAGVTHNATAPYTDATECKISDAIVKASTDAKGTAPSLEVSLKRVRGSKDVSKSNQEERNVLRRSDSSAFSRYKAAASNTNKASWVGNSQSGPPVVASFDVARKGAFHGLCSHSSNNIHNQRSNVGSNTVDMGSTTNNAFLDSSVSKNKSAVTSMVKHADTPCAVPRKIVSEKAVDELVATTIPAQPAKRDDSASKKAVTTLPHGGSSNAHGNGPFEGNNACNCSINGSASGSNHGSNHGSNGNNNGSSPAAVHAGGTNMESDNGIAGMSGSAGGDASGSGGGGSGSGDKLDTSRVLQREAALTKFRQKRKERCFRKKVRYQSRKRLADQRPRFRGQFVRKDANESTSGGATDN